MELTGNEHAVEEEKKMEKDASRRPSQYMYMTCPEENCAGDTLRVKLSNGQEAEVMIPDGIGPGQDFRVELLSEMNYLLFHCPPNTNAGQVVQVRLRDGRPMKVRVPFGVGPGDTFRVQVQSPMHDGADEEAQPRLPSETTIRRLCALLDDDPDNLEVFQEFALHDILTAVMHLLLISHLPDVGDMDPKALVKLYIAVASLIPDYIADDDVVSGLVGHVLDLARRKELLTRLVDLGLPSETMEQFASTSVFRSVLQAQYVFAGPRTVFRAEFFLFFVLFFSFSYLAYAQLVIKCFHNHDFLPGVMLTFLFLSVSYFSVREIVQMRLLRRSERKQSRRGLLASHPGGTRRFYGAIYKVRTFLYKYDPLTWIGLSKVWRRDFWNWIDVAAFGCVWVFSVMTALRRYGWYCMYIDDDGYDGGHLSDYKSHFLNLVCVTVLLLWLKVLAFLKAYNLKFSTFIQMLERIVRDLYEFVVVFCIFVLAFTHIFFFRLSPWDRERFDFHDDDSPNMFRTLKASFQAVYMLGFTGDFEFDNYPRDGDIFYLDLCILVVIVVMSNILIAIVNDSYGDAIKKAERLFWRSRMELITENLLVWGNNFRQFKDENLPRGRRLVQDIVEAEIKKDTEKTELRRRKSPPQLQKADLDASVQKLDDKLSQRLDDLSEQIRALTESVVHSSAAAGAHSVCEYK